MNTEKEIKDAKLEAVEKIIELIKLLFSYYESRGHGSSILETIVQNLDEAQFETFCDFINDAGRNPGCNTICRFQKEYYIHKESDLAINYGISNRDVVENWRFSRILDALKEALKK